METVWDKMNITLYRGTGRPMESMNMGSKFRHRRFTKRKATRRVIEKMSFSPMSTSAEAWTVPTHESRYPAPPAASWVEKLAAVSCNFPTANWAKLVLHGINDFHFYQNWLNSYIACLCWKIIWNWLIHAVYLPVYWNCTAKYNVYVLLSMNDVKYKWWILFFLFVVVLRLFLSNICSKHITD